MKKDDFIELVKMRHRDATSHWRKWRKESRECKEFVAGHQWTEEEMGAMEEAMRPAITFNRTDPMISAVIGHQINNRKEVRFIPRENGDVKINEMLTGAAAWVDDECDAEDEITDAFWDLVVSGVGWTETRMSYDEDAEGKIYSAERVPNNEMLVDPASRKRNFADARYVMREKWWIRKEAEARWPKIKGLDVSAEEAWADSYDEDMEGHDASEAWKYENDQAKWYKKEEDEVLILQYQYCEMEPIYVVGDPQSGRLIELNQKKYNRLKERIEQMGARVVKQMRKRYKQAFIMGPELLEDGDCPCPHSFTLRGMTGKRDEKGHTWYGLVRAMKDPQRWSNKFFSEIQDIMASNRTGGAYVEEGALVDPRRAEEDWNQVNPLIIVRDGALAGGRIQDRNPIQYPQGLDRMMEWAVRSIPDVTGINMELMGLVDRDQPGVLEMQRKRAGMTILANMFDSLRKHQKERGRVVLYFIQEYISDGRLIRILGEDGIEQFVPLTKAEGAAKFDIIVDESPSSPNQKEETFAVLMQLLPTFTQMGYPVPPEILDFAPLPSTLAQKWKQMLQPDAAQQQMQQRIQQLMLALEQKEREAKAYKDQTQGDLNKAKALVEQLQARLKPYEMQSQMLDRANK